jgi:hypothetical protein
MEQLADRRGRGRLRLARAGLSVLTLAVVLAACGAVFFTMLALEAARGRYEFPESVLRDLEA